MKLLELEVVSSDSGIVNFRISYQRGICDNFTPLGDRYTASNGMTIVSVGAPMSTKLPRTFYARGCAAGFDNHVLIASTAHFALLEDAVHELNALGVPNEIVFNED